MNLPEKPACYSDRRREAWSGEDEHEHGGESHSILAPQLSHPQCMPRRPRLHLHAGAGCQILATKGLVFAIYRDVPLLNTYTNKSIVLRCHRHE